MALKQFREAAQTAIIISNEEQAAGLMQFIYLEEYLRFSYQLSNILFEADVNNCIDWQARIARLTTCCSTCTAV